MRVGVGCEPPAQDVADHPCPAGPELAPRPHRGLIGHLALGGQIEPFSLADMIGQRLLHRGEPGQLPVGHLSDHTRTLNARPTAGQRIPDDPRWPGVGSATPAPRPRRIYTQLADNSLTMRSALPAGAATLQRAAAAVRASGLGCPLRDYRGGHL